MKEKFLKGSHATGLAIRIVVSVVIIAVIIWKYEDFKTMDIRGMVAASPNVAAGVGLIWGIYLLKSLVFVVPASLIYIAVGMAFPTHWAILINAVGILIEVCATYLFGIIMGGPYVINKLEKTKYGSKVLELHGKNKLSAIFAIRVLPVFPIDLISLFLGAVRMRFLPYLAISFCGIMPRVILFTILGDGLYDYIPMQKLALAAAILLPVALVVWVIRYAMKSNKKETDFAKFPYEPLKDSKNGVIFDTDIGPDCDDTGAFDMLIKYAKKYDVEILGAANCTTNKYGNGAIRAIAKHHGIENLPVGQHEGYKVLDDGDKYNKDITKKYFEDASKAVKAENSLEFYKKTLSKAKKNSVTVITVGTFTNIAEILKNEPKLFNEKVSAIISMAGSFPSGKEFNIESDIAAATYVFDNFKNVIICSGFEVGKDVKSGFYGEPENDSPIFDSYKKYIGGEAPYLRDSWDLTAVHYAFEGCGEFYELSKSVKITVEESGKTVSVKDKYSKRYYLKLKSDKKILAKYFDEILNTSADLLTI